MASTDENSTVAEAHSGGGWIAPLAATLVMQMVNAYLYFLVPTLAPVLSASAGQDITFVGWLAALSTAGSIVFMLMGTPLIHRWGPLRSLQVGTLVGGAGVLLLAAESAWAIVAGNILMGLGYGPSSPAGSDILHRFAPKRHRNLIFSVRQAGVPLSGLAAGLALPLLYKSGGMEWVIGTSIALVIVAVLIVQPIRRATDGDQASRAVTSPGAGSTGGTILLPLRTIASIPGLPSIALAGACLAVGHGCWVAYFVTYLTQVRHFSLTDAGVVFALMQGAGVVGRLLLGWLSDRLGSGVLVLRGVSIVSAATSVLLVVFGPAWSFAQFSLFALWAGMAVSSWNGIQIAAVAARAPAHAIAASASGATILVFLGFIAGPAGFAYLLGHTGRFDVCFGVTALVTLLAAVVLSQAGLDKAPAAGTLMAVPQSEES